MNYYNPTPTPRGDVTKLPKWAQEYVNRLINKIEAQARHIEEISSKHPGTNVVVSGGATYPDRHIEPYSTVDFYMGESREPFTDVIEVRHSRQNPARLDVTTYGGRLVIEPAGGVNSIRLRTERL